MQDNIKHSIKLKNMLRNLGITRDSYKTMEENVYELMKALEVGNSGNLFNGAVLDYSFPKIPSFLSLSDLLEKSNK